MIMRHIFRLASVGLLAALSACSPKLDVGVVLGGGVVITNKEESNLTIRGVVANNNPENMGCVQHPGTSLSPGESTTLVFLLCGTVTSVSVETDRGTFNGSTS
jgi:hypothetical protein